MILGRTQEGDCGRTAKEAKYEAKIFVMMFAMSYGESHAAEQRKYHKAFPLEEEDTLPWTAI